MSWNRKNSVELASRILHTVPVNADGVMSISELVRAIEKFRIGRQADETYEVRNDDGCIYLNGVPAFRVSAKAPKVAYSARAAYWEGRCLERGESDWD